MAGRQACTTSADTVQCLCTPQQRPTNMSSTTSAARPAFHQLPSKTAWSVLGQCKSRDMYEPWADDETGYILPCLRNVTPYTIFVPVKLRTQTVIY